MLQETICARVKEGAQKGGRRLRFAQRKYPPAGFFLLGAVATRTTSLKQTLAGYVGATYKSERANNLADGRRFL